MYQDKLGNNLMRVRVDTKYSNELYLHMFKLNIK